MKEKNNSKIRINMRSGDNKYLNGCLSPQNSWVTIEVSKDYNRVAEISLSMSQFATMLSSNMDTDCTIESLFNNKGELIKDIPQAPKKVHERLSDNLKDTQKQLNKRIEDLEKDLYEMVNGNVSKKKVKDALHDLQIIKSHYKSNEKFYLEEAKSEIEKISEEQKVQVLHAIASNSENSKKLIEELIPNTKKLLGEESSTPKPDSYSKKDRTSKKVKDMTLMEVADQIHSIYKKAENEGVEGLFGSGAVVSGKYVAVSHVSYQGSTNLKLEEAKEFLEYLKENGFINYHTYKRKQ